LNPPPQPVSGDISTKQTVAICIRRVSIQSDLSATRIVAATWSSSPPSKSLRWLSGILTHLGLPMRATAFTGAAAGAVPGGPDPQGKSGSAMPWRSRAARARV